MRKLAIMALTLGLMLSFIGCSGKTIHYNNNLGFDFSEIGYESVEFNVYHSNTKDYKWELLKTFSCSPREEHFADIRVEGKKNRVVITSEDNRVKKQKIQNLIIVMI